MFLQYCTVNHCTMAQYTLTQYVGPVRGIIKPPKTPNSKLSIICMSQMIMQVRAWPGQRLVIGVSGWDEFNHTTTATAGFTFTPLNVSQVNISD